MPVTLKLKREGKNVQKKPPGLNSPPKVTGGRKVCS